MIYLNEVANKISDILNSEDNPADFIYDVQCVGFHLDRIHRKREGRNSLMVFVSSMGGSFNPVYGLGEATASIPVTIYFPVRFKEGIFALDAYLHSVFVGASLDIGGNTGKVVSNLSVAQYGEIQDLDLREFKDWAESTYKRTIEVMEPYMSLQLTLYLSTLAEGYLYANSAKIDLLSEVESIDVFALNETQTLDPYALRYPPMDEEKTYITPPATYKYLCYVGATQDYYLREGEEADAEGKLPVYVKKQSGSFDQVGYTYDYGMNSYVGFTDLKFAQGSVQTMTQSSDHQTFGALESEGLPFSVTNGQSFVAYMKKGVDCRYLIRAFWDGYLPTMEFDLGMDVSDLGLKLSKKVYVQSFNMPLTKGQPLAATISLAKRMG